MWLHFKLWAAVVCGLVAAFVATWFAARRKGKQAQADADTAKQAQAEARAAQVARETYTAAAAAAAHVRSDAAKRPAPDPVARSDFDNTF